MRSLVFLRRGRLVDQTNLARLGKKKIVECGRWVGIEWLKSLRGELRDYRPHLVLSHGFNGHFIVFIAHMLGWLKGAPIATYHGPYHPMSRSGSIKKMAFDRFTDLYLKYYARAIVAVAGHERQALIQKGVDANKITVIHNGIIDTRAAQGAREQLRREWGIAPDTIMVGIISRLEPVKGIVDAIEALALVAPECAMVQMVIIGIGTQEAELKRLAAARGFGNRVHFVGFRSDVVDCYSAIDIFLLPSLSECHSIALLEAMRAARPIVATAVGGNIETVSTGEEAELVPAGAPRAMADALLSLIRNPTRSRLLGEAARRRFLAEFTAEVSLGKTVQWLHGCAATVRDNL